MAKQQNKKEITKVPTGKEKELQAKFPTNIKLVVLLALVSFLVYANTLKNGFALDDFHVVVENTYVAQGISGIPEILSTPYRRGYLITQNDLYRPLSLIMFAAEFQAFGLNPTPYHFTNIFLFACCVILLFLFFDTLLDHKKKAVAFIAALLFALHPLHTEVVANIKSGDELLCFLFAFLSLNTFIKYTRSGRPTYLLAGIVCFFLSLLSKETVITFLVIIPAIFFFINNENKKRSIYITAGTAAVAAVFLIIRFSVLKHYNADHITSIAFIDNALAKPDLSSASRIATALLILGYYLKLLFIPYPLISDYSFKSIPFANFNDPGVIISIVVYTSLLVLMVKLFSKNNKDLFAFSILFFLVTISLFSNIPFLIGATMGERFMFFPSVSFCLAIAAFIDKINAGPKAGDTFVLNHPKVLGVLIPLSIFYAIIVFERNGEWLDNYTLYASDVKKAPENCKLNYNLSVELHKIAKEEKDPLRQRKAIDESIICLRKALAAYPDFDDAEANLAYSYLFLSLYDSSELHDKKALLINPKNNYAINDLAGAYFFKKKYPEALELYLESIKLNPGYVNSYANAGICNLYLGKYDSATCYCNKAIAVDHTFNASYEILAATYKTMNKIDSARKYEMIAQKNNPGFKI